VKVAHLVHEEDLGQIGEPLVPDLRAPGEPSDECLTAGGRPCVNLAGRALGGQFGAARELPAALETFQRGIDLAQLSRPELSDLSIEIPFEIVAAGRCFETAQQDVFKTHILRI